VSAGEQPQEGWGIIRPGDRKAHYYRGTMSLCRTRRFYACELSPDTFRSRDDCATCRRALDREKAKAVHLDTGGRPRCGHPNAVYLSTGETEVTCLSCLLKLRGGNTLGLRHPDWQLRPHGTSAAARRHYRRGEKPLRRYCETCAQYEERRQEDRRARVRRAA